MGLLTVQMLAAVMQVGNICILKSNGFTFAQLVEVTIHYPFYFMSLTRLYVDRKLP